eukprot:562764-Amorphochlora_amoeboformis.AAC.1
MKPKRTLTPQLPPPPPSPNTLMLDKMNLDRWNKWSGQPARYVFGRQRPGPRRRLPLVSGSWRKGGELSDRGVEGAKRRPYTLNLSWYLVT